MFVGRARELQKLNQLYGSGHFEFAVFYGRRRVGKTTLIKEFIRGKDAMYYMAVEGTPTENLAGMSKAVMASGSGITFSTFEDLFCHVDSICDGKRIILVVDEYPYLAASYPAISSLIQRHIDSCWQHSKLFLILCGSSMSFMENQVLGYKSPLYGRRTVQFKLHPFTYFEAREMLCKFSKEEQAVLYGATGGIPEYLQRVDASKSLDENLISLFFDGSGRLFEEPTNLLKQELRDPSSYHSVISAIASGHSRMNEIATKTGLETGACSQLLASLISLGIVQKERPVTESENSRKTIYKLYDSMFTFWYRFVRPNGSAISQGVGESVYESFVKPEISDFMGSIFEEICRQYLFLPSVYGSMPFPIGQIGHWWGTNPKTRQQEEIDLMACTGSKMLLCECKWRNEPVNPSVLEKLLRRGRIFPDTEKYYYVFAKKAFTEAAVKLAAEKELHLVAFPDMV